MWTDFWMTHKLDSNIRKAIPALLSLDADPKLYDSPSPFRPAPTYNGVSTLSPQTTYDVSVDPSTLPRAAATWPYVIRDYDTLWPIR